MTFMLVYILFGVIPQTSLDMARMVPDHAVRLRGTSHGGKSRELVPMASGYGPQPEARDTAVPLGSIGIPRPEPNHYPLNMEDRYPSVFRVGSGAGVTAGKETRPVLQEHTLTSSLLGYWSESPAFLSLRKLAAATDSFTTDCCRNQGFQARSLDNDITMAKTATKDFGTTETFSTTEAFQTGLRPRT